jgi:hypothetical protein
MTFRAAASRFRTGRPVSCRERRRLASFSLFHTSMQWRRFAKTVVLVMSDVQTLLDRRHHAASPS